MAKTEKQLPHHVGIIMDGNGRWATKRGLSRNMGHRQGAETLKAIVRHAKKRGIRFLTVYAFSTENWNRPTEEIQAIMEQLRKFLRDAERYAGEGVRLKVIGDVESLDEDIQKRILEVEENSRHYKDMTLNIALNYGGRNELVSAARRVAEMLLQNKLDHVEQIDEALLAEQLYTAGQPDVDLVIRTSGEIRTSNFLLWQSAYAEYWFTDVLWPDFKPSHFDQALADYAARARRMGGI